MTTSVLLLTKEHSKVCYANRTNDFNQILREKKESWILISIYKILIFIITENKSVTKNKLMG